VGEDTREADIEQAKKVAEEFKELHQILNMNQVKMPIEEMAEKSICCIKFLQEPLKATGDSSDENIISLSKECHFTFEVPAKVWFDGKGCFTLPVYVEEIYIR